MNLRFAPFFLIGIVIIIVLIRNVVKKKFSERESFFWAIAGLIMILSPFLVDFANGLAHFIGIAYPPALVFALLFVFVFFLLFRLTSTVHTLNERITELVQLNSIYENELRSLKEKSENVSDSQEQDA